MYKLDKKIYSPFKYNYYNLSNKLNFKINIDGINYKT